MSAIYLTAHDTLRSGSIRVLRFYMSLLHYIYRICYVFAVVANWGYLFLKLSLTITSNTVPRTE
jgi:hypothetical protein